MTIYRIIFLAALLLGVNVSYAAYDEAEVIAYTKNTVSKLDSQLPKQALETWLKSLAGKRKISWEVNDCGESDGSGTQEDVPLCGAFTVHISSAQAFSAYIAVGTVQTGINTIPPQLFWAFIEKNKKVETSKLNVLPSLLQKTKKHHAAQIGNLTRAVKP